MRVGVVLLFRAHVIASPIAACGRTVPRFLASPIAQDFKFREGRNQLATAATARLWHRAITVAIARQLAKKVELTLLTTVKHMAWSRLRR